MRKTLNFEYKGPVYMFMLDNINVSTCLLKSQMNLYILAFLNCHKQLLCG
jgi:hypothetical protein